MCGLFALIGSINPEVDPRVDLDAAARTLEPRGPNAAGRYVNDHAALIHTRLSIVDLDTRSDQPFCGPRWHLAFNGEIVNFKALRARLRAEGATFRTEGDTEVLYAALDHWGPAHAVTELHGMYAFAAYDRHEEALWLARDPLGIKPLHYYTDERIFACGSWPSTLLDSIDAAWRLDQAGLAGFFRLGAVVDEDTLVEQVKTIPSGELWRVDRERRVVSQPFWNPAGQQRAVDVEAFEEVMSEVVTEQVTSDVPLALLLSGGVDSTVLASFLHGGQAFNLRSFETEQAAAAAARLGLNFHVEDATAVEDWEPRLQRFARATGTAFASCRHPLLMCEAMARSGFRVGLSANGADELFLGYPRTPAPDVPVETLERLPAYERPPVRSEVEQISHIFTNDANLLGRRAAPADVEAAEASMLARERRRLARAIERVGEEAAPRLYELQTYVAYDLNPNLDHCSMLHGIEMRVPFLDDRIVGFALGLPSRALITAQRGRKAPLKEILDRKRVPPPIWARRKLGFAMPVDIKINYRDDQLTKMKRLIEEGYLSFLPRRRSLVRDFQRTLDAASAFAAWKSVWIDSGVVRP